MKNRQGKKHGEWAQATINAVSAIVEKDGVILSHTDTVPGLLSRATHTGRAALNRIKHREQKPYIVLVDSTQAALEHAVFVDEEHADLVTIIALAVWPGPVTLIMRQRNCLDATVAVRVPDYGALRELAARCGPLLSTSANLTAGVTPQCVCEVDAAVVAQVDYVVNDEGCRHNGLASTILDCTTQEIRVVRAGAPLPADVEKLVHTVSQ